MKNTDYIYICMKNTDYTYIIVVSLISIDFLFKKRCLTDILAIMIY